MRRIPAVLAAVLLLTAAAGGCGTGEPAEEAHTAAEGSTESGAAALSEVTITVGVPEESVEVMRHRVEAFLLEHPEWAGVSIGVEAVEEDEAAADILADLSGTADVFAFRQDQLPSLVHAGALGALESARAASVRDRNSTDSVEAASLDGALCAYPLTQDSGYFLYYDSSVVEDPSDLDSILSACEAAGKNFCMELNSGWYQTAFFFGTGCTLLYDTDTSGNFTSCDIDYASDSGVAALRKMIQVAASSAFLNTSSAGTESGYAAIIDGPWDAEMAAQTLGENLACAKLPTFTGTDGTVYQMSGFAEYRLLGVRAGMADEKEEICAALADFLTDDASQEALYEEEDWYPTSLAARESGSIRSDETALALMEQMEMSIPQREYPVDYWSLATALGDDVLQGNLTENSSDEDLMAALQSFQDTCASYAQGEDK